MTSSSAAPGSRCATTSSARPDRLEALESLRRQQPRELGRRGVRTELGTVGIPDAIPSEDPGRDKIVEPMNKATILGRAATVDDAGNAAGVRGVVLRPDAHRHEGRHRRGTFTD